MPTSSLNQQLSQLHRHAVQSRQRRLLVLAGSQAWALSILSQLPASLREQHGLWVGQPSDPRAEFADNGCFLKPSRCHQVLGREFGWVVLDAHGGLDPDALGACSGTLCGGGLLVLLVPASQSGSDSAFTQWLWRQLKPAAGMLLLNQDAAIGEIDTVSDSSAQSSVETAGAAQSSPLPGCSDPGCLTEDQAVAVAQIQRVVTGHRRRPLVISADRGRGKSAALGIAAARLMQQRSLLIRVTAPNATAIEPLFERLQALLPQSQRQGDRVVLADSQLEFVALDQLLLSLPAVPLTQGAACGLLLVDEAAAIPAPMLEQLLRHHSRVVFSTTTHGYEGTGRGFQIRFRQTLDHYTPGWRQLELQAPIRWSAGDPLERWVFDTLLLDAEPETALSPATFKRSKLTFSCWSAQQLIDNPDQLRQVFGLLVQAHYRTKPGDLRDLLDDPSMQIWLLHAEPEPGAEGAEGAEAAATARRQLVGVLWVAAEGGFEPELAEAIWLGKRRPRGHLLPQVLAAQAGWQQAAELRYWRIVRIAVPEPLRRQGIGAELVRRLLAEAKQQPQVDLVGTSFGATADLLPFWFAQQLQPLRLGLKRDASSGCVSLIYGCGCSEAGQALNDAIAERFSADLPGLLRGAQADLDAKLVRLLLVQTQLETGQSLASLARQDWLDLYSFTFGQRQLQQVEPALYRWSLQLLAAPVATHPDRLSSQLERFLIERLLQRRDWSLLLPWLELSGPRQAEAMLRQALQPLLADHPELIGLNLGGRAENGPCAG